MSESPVTSESTDERSPGFKRSLTGKLVAAGIFVLLGTVAVAYSMNYCRTCADADDGAVAKKDDSTAVSENDKNASAAKQLSLKPISDKTPAKLNASLKSGEFTNSSTASPSGKKNDFSGSFKNQPNRVTAQRPTTDLPESKSFSMPKVVKSQGSGPSNPGNQFGRVQQVKSPSQFNGPAKRNTFKQPLQENKGPVSNGLQNLKNGTSQFANNTANTFKKQAGELTQKTGNALRNFRDQANGAANNLTSGNPSNVSSFAPPATSPSKQSELPPITPRASFDSSKDLKPFSNKPVVASKSGANQSTFGSGPPVANPRTNNQINNVSQLRPAKNLSPGTGRSNLNTRPSLAPSNLGTPASTSSLNVITQSTPGDRKFEGVQSPTVTIEKIAPREIQVNQPADFELVVKNVGRIPAKNVKVFDQIPTGTELIQTTPRSSRGQNNQINWDLDTLNPGQEKRIKIQLRPIRPGEIGSVAQVTFSAVASMRTKVTKPELAIRHETESKVLIGDTVVLNIDVKNEGDGPAKNVIIQEDIPEGLEFSEGFRELEYEVGTLGPGQSRKVRLELRAAKIGKYRNILVAHAGGGLQTQHAVDVEVVAPMLQASGDGPTRRFLNREATHRFAVRNSGTANATNVELVCRLPNGLKYISANNRGKYDENSHSVYWSLAELGAGLVANVEVTNRSDRTRKSRFEV